MYVVPDGLRVETGPPTPTEPLVLVHPKENTNSVSNEFSPEGFINNEDVRRH